MQNAPLPAAHAFRQALFARGLLIPTGVDGLYGRAQAFEQVVAGLEGFVSRLGADQGAEAMRFPPAMPRAELERSGYLKSFPQLVGTVHCFCGNERDHRELLRCLGEGEDWTRGQQASAVALLPAACYPVYPTFAARGPLPEGGQVVDVMSYCFRHEPSLDPARMQLFRQREYVCLGDPDRVAAFRDLWIERGRAFAVALGLVADVDVAHDAFFGRSGRLMAEGQLEQRLKFELLVTTSDPDRPTACVSFNSHQDHFGEIWGLRTAAGEVAHTACVGFGLERLTLALLARHGFEPREWPPAVREVLWPSS